MRGAINSDTDDCIIWPYHTDRKGYAKITINKDVYSVHRIVCASVHGDPSGHDLHAAHKCNNESCVNPKHLYWATRGQNEQDKSKCPIVAAACGRKLSPAKVLDARARHRRGQSILSIARLLGVQHKTAKNAITGKTWSWVSGSREGAA